MKLHKLSSLLIVLVLLFVAVSPASAQLGTTDTSQFTVQNIEDPTTGATASVTIIFVSETGQQITPAMLSTTLANPFSLQPGKSQQILVANVPGLTSGRYSVIVGSTAKVAAMVGVAGDGPAHFNGSYTGFSSGSQKVYLASAHYNGSGGWYAMVTVQNLGTSAANVKLTLNCSNGSTGSLTKDGLPSMASHTFVLKNTPMTFTPATSSCTGSATVESTNGQPLVVVNNQNVPTSGSTNTIEGYPGGARTVFVPNLSNAYSGWNSALNIRKIGSGNTTVTVDYDDAEPNDSCALTDATPSCQLYMPSVHPTKGRFGAKITSTNLDIITSVGGTNSRNSGAYVGVSPDRGTVSVAIPLAMKRFYGYVSAINCQNLTNNATKLDITFAGFPVVHDQRTLTEGQSMQVLTIDSTFNFLPNSWYGGVTVQAVNSSARIACTVGNTNMSPTSTGDWNNQYNAFQR